MSVKDRTGWSSLEQAIADLFFSGELEGDDAAYVSNARHIASARAGESSLKRSD